MKKPKISEEEIIKSDLYHHTLDEVAAEIGVSRQHVAKIIDGALKKIRRELFKRGLEKDDIL